MNPFHHRGPITDSASFFGRARELDGVLARVASVAKPQCVSVVGPRRIGKSSLLRQVADAHGPRATASGPLALFVYESLEGTASATVDRFFSVLVRRIGKQLARAGSEEKVPQPAEGRAEEAFADWIEDLADRDVRVVLLLDEFDAVTMNPSFDAAVFGRLRYLAGTFPLACVTGSFAPLADLCHHEEIRQSPFFNVFTTVNLGLLDDAAADELLRTESARGGRPFDDADRAFVRALAGEHAFHLQQAATALWDAADPSDRDAVKQQFLDDAAPHFRYAVDHLPPQARETLGLIARGDVPAGRDTPDLVILRRQALVTTRAGAMVPFSDAFREWIVGRALTPTRPAAGRIARDEDSDTAPSAREARPGFVLDDRLALRREIGRGGFGIVFEAEDLLLGRKVAVKVLRPERILAEDGVRSRERLLVEARAAGRIAHPNVITLHDARFDGDQLFIVMELFHGRSVRALLNEHRLLGREDAIDLMVQAADGVGAAHDAGMVHRDLKPENLVVDERGRLKVVDFGLAYMESLSRLTPASQAILTPRYCSPEQVTGETVGAPSDVFSLGCVLHELLVGAPPFDGDTVSAVLYAIVNGSPPAGLAARQELSGGLEDLLRRCLAREPADRPATAGALAAELRALR